MINPELFELSRFLIQQLHRPYQRYLMEQNPFSARCTILTGSRGVGKTTCIVQHLVANDPNYEESEKSLYLPADHFLVEKTSLYELARNFVHHGGTLLCFDEVHKYPKWSRDLKSIVDTFPNLRLIISGSSMLHLHRGTHDLSRRAIVKKLAGFSFREFLELRLGIKLASLSLKQILRHHEKETPAIVKKLTSKKKMILREFQRYLASGYYPYSQNYKDLLTFQMTLQQGMHTTLESDLLALYPSLTGTSVARLKRLLAAISESVPFTPDLTRLRKLLHIADDRTLKEYLQYLEDAELIMTLHRHGKKLRAMEKPDKIYLGDPNQHLALSSKDRTNHGTLRETFFCRTISTQHEIRAAERGDFLIDDTFLIEVGGQSKGHQQIMGKKNSFLALDDLPVGSGNRVPLWLFGFLY
ncbi:MAG: 3-dehydroquinate dehydratase [Verrucomicrobia bacterium]|nr:3-dehydroquinate dehydratase [Verrucomicrobiota bacterium]